MTVTIFTPCDAYHRKFILNIAFYASKTLIGGYIMNKKLKLISIILCFSWISLLYSQAPAPKINVSLEETGIQNYQQIFLSDFDFLQVGGSADLFTIIIEKRNFMPDDETYADINLQLTQNNNQSLAMVQTNQFQLPQGNGIWRITNKQLASKKFNFNGDSPDVIQFEQSGLDNSAKDLRNQILESSQIPVGVYTLTTTLRYYLGNRTSPPNTTQGINEIRIVVTNPTLINLISPGMLLNSGYKYEVYTQNPLFQWNGNSGDYQVVVFKKRNDFDTIDEILNSVPVWESGHLNSLFVQYPDFGAVPLEYGSEYVWEVLSYINTSSGENTVRSELWAFTVVDPSQSNITMEAIARQELEQILRQLLGDRAETIIRQINDYNLSSIRVNGSVISVPELYQILEKYRNQKHEVYDLILRSSN